MNANEDRLRILPPARQSFKLLLFPPPPGKRLDLGNAWPPVQYAMNDDTSPCELNPDPFEEDMNAAAREQTA